MGSSSCVSWGMLGGDGTCWVLRSQTPVSAEVLSPRVPHCHRDPLGVSQGGPAHGLAGHGGHAGAQPVALALAQLLAQLSVRVPSGVLPWGRASVYLCPALPEPGSSRILHVSGCWGAVLGRERVAKQTVLPVTGTPGTVRRIRVMPRPRRLARLVVCRRVYRPAPSSLFHPCLRRLPCPSPRGLAGHPAGLAAAPHSHPVLCRVQAATLQGGISASAPLLSPDPGQVPAASPWSSRESAWLSSSSSSSMTELLGASRCGQGARGGCRAGARRAASGSRGGS